MQLERPWGGFLVMVDYWETDSCRPTRNYVKAPESLPKGSLFAADGSGICKIYKSI